jgi:hypothetical protein
MKWDWQQPGRPEFTWNPALLAEADVQFLLQAGTYTGTVKHLGAPDREQVTVEAMSIEAVTTSEIEGEILDRDSVQSSIRRQLGLATDNRKVGPAERGTSEMMVDCMHPPFRGRQWPHCPRAGRKSARAKPGPSDTDCTGRDIARKAHSLLHGA